MSKRKDLLQLTAGFVLFGLAVICYFKFSDRGQNSIIIPSKVVNDEEEKTEKIVLHVLNIDFDSPEAREKPDEFISGKAYTGNFSNYLNKDREYSAGISLPWKSIPRFEEVKEIRFHFYCNTKVDFTKVEGIFSIDSIPGATISWQNSPVLNQKGVWSKVTLNFPVDKTLLHPEYFFKLYIWNKSKQEFIVDDYSVEFIGHAKSVNTNKIHSIKRYAYNGFEPLLNEPTENFTTDETHSGKHSYLLTSGNSYSPAITRKINEVSSGPIALVTISVWVKPTRSKFNAEIVVILKNPQGDEYFWEGRNIEKGKIEKGVWTKHRAQMKLPVDKISPEDQIVVYLWNKGNSDIIIDDMEVVYGEQQARAGNDPFINTTDFSDKDFEYKRGVQPFRTMIYVQNKQLKIHNTKVSKQSDSEIWSPDVLIASGNFIRNSNLSQVVKISERNLEV